MIEILNHVNVIKIIYFNQLDLNQEKRIVQMNKKYLLLRSILRIFIPALLTIILYIIAIFFIILPNIEQGFMERKKEMTSQLIDSQWHILQYYYNLEKQGVRTRKQAQERVIELFRNIRYGEDQLDYFWINDFHPKMVMHPYRSDLDGADLSHYADQNGTFLFKEMVDIIMKDCEGYVDYIWQWHDNEDINLPKISYVKGFWPWQWVIGTGVYVDDVEAEMKLFVERIVKFSALILIVVTGLSILIVVQSSLSDKKRISMEEDLARSHAEYKSLVDHINLGVFRSDIRGEGKFIKINTAMARIFGYESAEELMGVTPMHLFGSAERRTAFLADVIEKGGVKNREKEMIKKDGSSFWSLITITVTHDVNSEALYFDGVVEDITERRKMASEKEQLLKTLAVKNEELESIIYISSHDLRTPLLTIQGFRTELEKACVSLKDSFDGMNLSDKSRKKLEIIIQEDIPHALDHIRSGISKISNLIDGLLVLSKVASIQKVEDVVDVDRLVRTVVENKKIDLSKNGASVVIDQLPACVGNFSALRDVFANLVDNAIHYRNPDRPLQIHISAKTDDSRVIYCIEDNGIGIEEQYQKQIFNIFHKLHPQESSAGEGLGLTITKRILDHLDGTIWVESEVHKFTRFYISLHVAE